MTDKQIIIDGVDVSGCAYFYNRECRCLLDCVNHYENKPIQELFNRDTQIHTNCETSPNCYYKQLKRKEQELNDYRKQFKADTKEMEDYQNEIVRHLESIEYWRHQAEAKEQECERLKEKLNPKLKNAHCTYFEGQTGLCKAKEFTKCNPVNCKLYTIDELSTIVELQQQLNQLKSENDALFKAIEEVNKINKKLKVENEELKKTIDDLLHKPEIQDKILWKIDNEALLGSKDAWIYKLEKTLAEIKEFVENEMTQNGDTYIILNKINECEGKNG